MRALAVLLALAAVATAAGPAAGSAPDDRLARFRELGLRYGDGQGDAGALASALFELVDDEIVENLGSGQPFASAPFIQERLEALGAAWGGMSLRLGRSPTPRGTLVAVLGLAGAPPVGSVRFYGAGEGGPRLLASATHEGRPETYAWPGTARDATRIAVSWIGAGSAAAGHPLWLEVWELRADRDAAAVWQSAAAFPDGLVARGFAVRAGRIAVRYAAPYAAFKAGCEGQTEQEDVFGARPPSGAVALVSRRVSHPWHREVSDAAERLFRALAAGDRPSLARLVPDPTLRSRLPAALGADGSCDERADNGRAALVSATETTGDRLRPWTLRFARAGAGWRLVAATPVLQ